MARTLKEAKSNQKDAKNYSIPPLLVCARGFITDERHPGEVLLVQRSDGSAHNAGEWELPGGKFEVDERKLPKESFEQAVGREIGEETGACPDHIGEGKLIDMHEIHGGKHDGAIVLTFVGRVAVHGGELQHDEESSAIGWFSLEALPANMTDISRRAIEEIAPEAGLPWAA